MICCRVQSIVHWCTGVSGEFRGFGAISLEAFWGAKNKNQSARLAFGRFAPCFRANPSNEYESPSEDSPSRFFISPFFGISVSFSFSCIVEKEALMINRTAGEPSGLLGANNQKRCSEFPGQDSSNRARYDRGVQESVSWLA